MDPLDGISGGSRIPAPDDDPPRPPPGSRVSVPRPMPMPHLPDTDAPFVQNAVKAHVAKTAAVTTRGDGDARSPIQQRLDAFLEQARPTFHVSGHEVQVPITFRMTVEPSVFAHTEPSAQPFVERERVVQANLDELKAAARTVDVDPNEILAGRVSPQGIRRVTQALIDAGKLPPGTDADLPARVRRLMNDHGIGIDCASYTQQAFLSSRGLTRGQAHFKPLMLDEDLRGLSERGFRRIEVKDMRPGDLFVLSASKGQVGHTAIVSDSKRIDAAEARTLKGLSSAWNPADDAHVRKVDVDTSWGSGASAERGGVQRQTWWYDEDKSLWLSHSSGRWRVDKTPYAEHTVEGAYRPGGEP